MRLTYETLVGIIEATDSLSDLIDGKALYAMEPMYRERALRAVMKLESHVRALKKSEVYIPEGK